MGMGAIQFSQVNSGPAAKQRSSHKSLLVC